MLSTSQTSRDQISTACTQLREADRLIADSLRILGDSDVESATGLSTEVLLQFDARLTRRDARMLLLAMQTLRQMGRTREAVLRGMLSWGQLRAISLAATSLDPAGRANLDQRIGALAPVYADRDPEDLLVCVEDIAASLRPDLLRAKEDRAIEREFLAVQGRLDGGASLYGECGPESAATILERLDADAALPVSADDEGAPTRAQQRMRALVEICAQDGGAHRARPRLIVHADLEDLRAQAGSTLLWPLPGRAPRLSHVTTQMLACDATVTAVVSDNSRPIYVGDSYANVTAKQRTALIARDQGCRFPGCSAPAQWTDAHHIRWRSANGPTSIDNLISLCRKCHRRIHRFRWRIIPKEHGVIEFRHRRRTLHSHAKSRFLGRE